MVTSAKTSFHSRGFFVPPGNELEEQVSALNIHREIADLVNDEYPVLVDFIASGQCLSIQIR